MTRTSIALVTASEERLATFTSSALAFSSLVTFFSSFLIFCSALSAIMVWLSEAREGRGKKNQKTEENEKSLKIPHLQPT